MNKFLKIRNVLSRVLKSKILIDMQIHTSIELYLIQYGKSVNEKISPEQGLEPWTVRLKA